MFTRIYLAVLFIVYTSNSWCANPNPQECAWSKSLANIKSGPSVSMQCKNKEACSGFDCSARYHFQATGFLSSIQQDIDYCYGIKVYTCALTSPKPVDLYIDLPFRNKTHKERFNQNVTDKYIPEASFSVPLGPFAVTFRPYITVIMFESNNQLNFSAWFRTEVDRLAEYMPPDLNRLLVSFVLPLHNCPRKIKPPDEVSYTSSCNAEKLTTPKPIGTKKPEVLGKACDPSVSNINQCNNAEYCYHDSKCICIHGRRDAATQKCPAAPLTKPITTTASPVTSAVNATHAAARGVGNNNNDNNKTVIIACSVVGGLVVIAVIAGVAFYFIRKRRLVPYANHQLLLSGDDDDDNAAI